MKWLRRLLKTAVALLSAAGAVFLIALALAFTPWPWRAIAWLAANPAEFSGEPEYIVVLAGGGIPSNSGLIRSYYGAVAAKRHPDAVVLLAIPHEGDFESSAAGRMRAELILRGVEADRIVMESRGRNTREQALNAATQIDANPRAARVLIVTSPDHMKRAILAFRKAGFLNLSCTSAFSESIEYDLGYNAGDLGGPAAAVPDIGQSMTLRYDIWNNLSYELAAIRELVALAYYKLQGWI